MSGGAKAGLRVVVVGAGNVGRALGTNLAGLGHQIHYAVRTPTAPGGVEIDGAAAHADLTILALPFGAIGSAVPRLGLGDGAMLVDATNPFGQPLPDGVASGAEHVARTAGAGVRVVKAFNVLGAEHMTHPPLDDGSRPVLPVASDDDRARRLVVTLANEMGFDAVDVGGIGAAGLMEEAARYWGLLAFAGGRGRAMVLVAHRRGT
jgi:hypothetical protein